MRFIEASLVVRRWSLAPRCNQRLVTDDRLIKLPSLTVGRLLFVECLLALRFGLFFSRFENSFFVAANALVGVQAFENELCRRYLLLSTFFLRDAEWSEFIHQTLNFL